MTMPRTGFLAAGGLILAALAGAARAAPGVVDWPTFFRTGPGVGFVAVQELSRGSVVDVQSCSGQWCMVQIGRVTGYVEASTLGKQAPASQFSPPAANAACFDSQRAGYEGGERFKYCPR